MHVLGMMVFTDENEKSAEFKAEQCFKQNTPKFTHKCDFFDVGGRWSRIIVAKNGKHVNSTKVGNVKNVPTPFALCVDGKWHYKNRSAMYMDYENKWQKRFEGYWNKLPQSATVVLVDLHY